MLLLAKSHYMKWIPAIIAIFLFCVADAQKKITVSSPDKMISFSLQLTKQSPLYNISYKGKTVIQNAPVSLAFLETGEFKSNLSIGKVQSRKGEEKYELIVGRSRF